MTLNQATSVPTSSLGLDATGGRRWTHGTAAMEHETCSEAAIISSHDRRTWPAAISLRSSISKTLTAATSSIQMELAFGAGVAVEDEISFVFCLFVTAIVHYNQSDL